MPLDPQVKTLMDQIAVLNLPPHYGWGGAGEGQRCARAMPWTQVPGGYLMVLVKQEGGAP